MKDSQPHYQEDGEVYGKGSDGKPQLLGKWSGGQWFTAHAGDDQVTFENCTMHTSGNFSFPARPDLEADGG